jgi:hypothetical protein
MKDEIIDQWSRFVACRYDGRILSIIFQDLGVEIEDLEMASQEILEHTVLMMYAI